MSAAAGLVEAEIKKQLELKLGEDAAGQIDKAVEEVKAGIGGLFGF